MVSQQETTDHIRTGMLLGMAQMGATFKKQDETHVYFEGVIGSEIDNYEAVKRADEAFVDMLGLRLSITMVPPAPHGPDVIAQGQDYTAQIAAVLREVLYEPWMTEEEWQQVMAPFREMLDPARIDAEVATGIAAGFPFDVQLATLRLLLQQEEQQHNQGRAGYFA